RVCTTRNGLTRRPGPDSNLGARPHLGVQCSSGLGAPPLVRSSLERGECLVCSSLERGGCLEISYRNFARVESFCLLRRQRGRHHFRYSGGPHCSRLSAAPPPADCLSNNRCTRLDGNLLPRCRL